MNYQRVRKSWEQGLYNLAALKYKEIKKLPQKGHN